MPSHSDQQLSNLNIHVFPDVATYQYAVQQSEVGATDICLIEGTPSGGSTVSVSQGDSSIAGSLVGDVTVNSVTTHLYVKPASSGLLNIDSGKKYAGVVRPFMTTTGLLNEQRTDFAYIGNAESGNDALSKILKVYTDFSKCECDLMAIPVLTDVNIDPDTGRYDSVPYIVLPESLVDAKYETLGQALGYYGSGGIEEEPKLQ